MLQRVAGRVVMQAEQGELLLLLLLLRLLPLLLLLRVVVEVVAKGQAAEGEGETQFWDCLHQSPNTVVCKHAPAQGGVTAPAPPEISGEIRCVLV